MINTLIASLSRVTLFWYFTGVLVLFLGSPEWAEARYSSLMQLPWVPKLELNGILGAARVQGSLLVYWTAPVLGVWLTSIIMSVVVCEARCQLALRKQRSNLKPTGEFWGVTVGSYSLGHLPRATTPYLTGSKVSFSFKAAPTGAVIVELKGAVKEAVKLLTPTEQQLCEELIQLLLAQPDHYAGLGHGVGLLEHTLNVVAEAAGKCTTEFRLPIIAALAHDIGKLVTFQPDGKGGWQRKGLHSRESARILATLPGFQELPLIHQNGLLLAVKYDHAPSKMPELAGDREASMLAMRIISALSQSDRTATAGEKDRHLERIKPEDLLFKDFIDFLREAPVVQRGKPGVANQLNNPEGSPYLYIYEAAWRDAAVRRLPAEVAAALDLTRRDAGKLAKYTRILTERLRKENLLVETHIRQDRDGTTHELSVSESNPLWDIQSGTGEKAVVLRGILMVHAEALWKSVNFRLGTKSPYPVEVLAPNADAQGRVNSAPAATRESAVDISDSLKVSDLKDSEAMAAIGLLDPADAPNPGRRNRARGRFQEVPSTLSDDVLGLSHSTPSQAGLKLVESNTTPPSSESAVPEQDSQEPGTPEPHALAKAATAEESLNQPIEQPSAELGAASVSSTQPQTVLPAKHPHVAEAMPPAISVTPMASKPATRRSQFSGQGTKQEPLTGLSWSESQAGLAIADDEALHKYPHLQLGDKFYTEDAPAVKAGQAKPGSRYRGAKEPAGLTLSAGGPRRGRRNLS